MSTKIACPHCGHVMAIKSLKTGKFKPTCTSCKEIFVLVVDASDPPKVKVGKGSKTPADPRSTETKPTRIAAEKTAPIADSGEPRLRPITPAAPLDTSIEATIDSTSVESPPPSMEATWIPAVDEGVSELGQTTRLAQVAESDASDDSQVSHGHGETIEQEAIAERGAESLQEPEAESTATQGDVGGAKSGAMDFDLSFDVPNVTSDVLATRDEVGSSGDMSAIEATMDHQADAAAGGASQDADFSMDSKPATVAGGDRTKIETRASGSDKVPDRLGGYRILKELGRGGMGSVYLARQLSLDRQVAIKTIQTVWASNPRVIARFIREAYAAAQLTHHNVVQIYDLGADKGINYFSMELVRGGSLDDLLKGRGKLNARTAALYILQAARGLKFAHDHGMVHRDIKPANLMLTENELVKVADLGLVKTPTIDEGEEVDADRNIMLASAHSRVTGVGSTMGTPAYMSPEQADDAANVDLRADIYSLGCTFYALLTGSPPFTSESAIEIITKHRTSRVERPDRIMQDVPSELGAIVEKMTAKDPADRYQSLGETIRDLEKFLAIDTSQPFKPQQDHVARLDQAARDFHAAPASKLRKWFPIAFIGACGFLFLISLFLGLRAMTSVVVLTLATPIAIGVMAAIQQGSSPIGSRLRSLVAGSSWSDRLIGAIGLLLLIVLAYFLSLMIWWGVALGLAVAIAFAYQGVVVQPLRAQRTQPLNKIDGVLRELRLGGLSETSIQRFLVECGGKGWEEVFEQVYDYDSLRQARADLVAAGRAKTKIRYQPWRDYLIDRMENKIQAVRAEREQRILQKIEQANLKAAGVSAVQAKQQAAEMAASLVQVATETRQKSPSLYGAGNDEAATARRERMKQMLQAARSGKSRTLGTLAKRTTFALFGHLLGGKLRFLVGAALLLGCLAWANQNDLLNAKQVEEIADQVNKGTLAEQASKVSNTVKDRLTKTEPWNFPLVGNLFTSFAPGLMGLLVLGSSLIYGWRFSLFAIPAAILTLLGPSLNIPSFGFSQGAEWTSFGIGLVIFLVGLVLGRHRN